MLNIEGSKIFYPWFYLLYIIFEYLKNLFLTISLKFDIFTKTPNF